MYRPKYILSKILLQNTGQITQNGNSHSPLISNLKLQANLKLKLKNENDATWLVKN